MKLPFCPCLRLLGLPILVCSSLTSAAMAQARAALVQDVDQPARNVFVLRGVATGAAGASTTFTVPAGLRYVVDQYSAECRANIDGTVVTNVQLTGTAASQETFTAAEPRRVGAVVSVLIGFSAYNRWVATGNGPFYADPGTIITASANSSASDTYPYAGIQGCTFYLSGHTVPVP